MVSTSTAFLTFVTTTTCFTKSAANAEVVKVISSGNLNKSVVLKGIKATKGAKTAIEAAGGKVEE